ncbi:MAG: nitrilase-related carbon-nitrogen hydrolase [Pseudomonadota bacterium]|nr:nitrilase-related carbon-nitrogen hydrolase [Pseudomonadota bacterium]
MALYYAAACQTDLPSPADRAGIAANTHRMCALAEQTIAGYEPFFDIRLLAFPEFAHSPPVYDSVKLLRRHLALPIPNEHTAAYERVCRRHGCYIQTGTFLEVDDAYPDALFNTTVLIGPGGILARYRKVNPWIPWEVHTSPHDLHDYRDDPFPVVQTELGRLGVAICYDWLFPETIREIASRGADVIIRVSAYMDPWGATPPMDWWSLVNRTRALENMVYVVAANQGAQLRHYPPFSWPGGSMVVDYDGRILAQADPGPGEKVVVAPIDTGALRAERDRRAGHDTLAHHRAELHRYATRAQLSRQPRSKPITVSGLRERIARGKRRLRARYGQ